MSTRNTQARVTVCTYIDGSPYKPDFNADSPIYRHRGTQVRRDTRNDTFPTKMQSSQLSVRTSTSQSKFREFEKAAKPQNN